MKPISTSEKFSSWERIKQALVDSSEKESKKPLGERLKEEALIPLHLYKGAVKGALQLLESGIGFNGLKDSIHDLHRITTDGKGFEVEKKQQKEAILQAGKQVYQFGKESCQNPEKKLHELWNGGTETVTQKAIHFLELPRTRQAEVIGGLAPDVALSAIGMEEAAAAIRAKRLLPGFEKIEERAIRKIPLAFSKPKEFSKFSQTLKVGLEEAGFQDSQVLFRGSSVTGRSFRTGEVFSLERGSDLDIALAGKDIFDRAKRLRIPLVRNKKRTWPLESNQIKRLGLEKLLKNVQSQTPYKVSIMIYDSVESVTRRGPHILTP